VIFEVGGVWHSVRVRQYINFNKMMFKFLRAPEAEGPRRSAPQTLRLFLAKESLRSPRAAPLPLFTELPTRLVFSETQRAYKESWGIYLCPNPLPSERCLLMYYN
jgi:hypothetical protein